MYGMDLFAGVGGFSLGLKLAFGPEYRTVCYVENDDYCLQVLKARIADGFLNDAPIWDDITTFEGTPWRDSVDIITAGFPCQPYSRAGLGDGGADERNLWPALCRVIGEVEPRIVLLENVPSLATFDYFGIILGQLAESFQDIQGDCVPASAISANHQRDRLWIIATNPHSDRPQGLHTVTGSTPARSKDWIYIERVVGEIQRGKRNGIPKPWVLGKGNGLPGRMERTKALGNSIVPAVVPEFLRRIK